MQQAGRLGRQHVLGQHNAALLHRRKLEAVSFHASSSVCRAAAGQAPTPSPSPKKRPVRNSGYFSDADPNRPVGNPLSTVTPMDVTKKAGRYGPEFVWQTNWKDAMDLQADQERQRKEAKQASSPPSGNLSIRRVQELDSMDVDLSQYLQPRPGRQASPNTAAEGRKQRIPSSVAGLRSGYAANPPSQGEARRWERSGRFVKRAPVTPPTEEESAALAAAAEVERERYQELKLELQLWTLAAGALGMASCWVFYSQDIAFSYGAGALGGFLYLRALNRSVDALGQFSVGSLASNQRLLIPVILALGYNRFNTLASEQTGVTLQLLPMLLGFFTYKAAVVAKQSLVLLGELAGGAGGGSRAAGGTAGDKLQVAGQEDAGPSGGPPEAPSVQEASGRAADDARRREVESLFNRRMLSG